MCYTFLCGLRFGPINALHLLDRTFQVPNRYDIMFLLSESIGDGALNGNC